MEREDYEISTDRVSFYTHDILKYDLNTHTYYVADRFSPALESKMRMVMHPEVREAYDKFIFANWGPRKPSGDFTERDEVAEAVLQYKAIEEQKAKEAKIEVESLGDLEMISETEESENKDVVTSLDITKSETQNEVSEEDLEDAAIFFDFFDDGGVDV